MKKLMFFFLAFPYILFSQKNIITLFQKIEIKEDFEGNIASYFSPVLIEGKINGDIFILGGFCYLKKNSQVRNITVIFGNVKMEEGAKIEKNKILIAPIEEEGTNFQNKVSLSLFWLFFSFFLTLIFPSQIATSIFIFKNKIKESFLIGLISILLFFLLFSLFYLFTSLYIGWPLLLSLIGFFFIAKAYGMVVLFWTAGKKIAKSFGKIGSLFTGWLLISLIRLIPYIGSFFWVILTLFSIGIVIIHLNFKYKESKILAV